ncbi:MAG: flagellar hook-basal body complex protein [Planctomycetota bacterium]|jgi:flagellar hook protein FlgE
MSIALSAGVTGLESYQKMLDIAGDNLANVGTTGFKSSRITFSQLLSETIKTASQPTSTVGGTNPQQLGHGVGVASITPIMTQGNISNTGNPLDLAIEGDGYYTLNDGSQDLYTRAGAFAVDANSRLVDPATGYIVQRIGTVGESDGFQIAGDSDVRIPTDVSMPAKATTEVKVTGNLSTDASFATTQTNVLTSDIVFTVDGSAAGATEAISDLDQYTGSTWADGTLTFSGYKPNGVVLGGTPATDLTMSVTATTTLQDVLDYLNTDDGGARTAEIQTVTLTGGGGVPDEGKYTLTYEGATTVELDYNANIAQITAALDALASTPASGGITPNGILATGTTFTFADSMGDSDGEVGLITINSVGLKDGGTDVTGVCAETVKGHGPHGVLDGAEATLVNGKIRITDTASGYSKSDFKMTWSDSNLTVPAYFEVTTAGGDEVKNVNITVFDSQGGKHVLSAAFVRTGTANTWDMIMTAISGNITDITFDNRRINGLEFYADSGSFKGLNAATGDTAQFAVTFAHDTANPQTIDISMGSIGQFDGLTQFAGNSTAVAREQDGYAAGSFSSLSVNNEGIVVGAFTNGIKKDIAALQLALFQNPTALEAKGSGYFSASANSGEAIATQALSGGAGGIQGGALEASNVQAAKEFVSLIQAQNYYQANARTIKVANDMLRELTNIIR